MNMNKVRITAIRQTVYEDLMARYENPIEHTCDAQQARLLIARVAAKHGHNETIPVPDYSTKAKAQAAIGLDMQKLKSGLRKQRKTAN